MPAISRTESGHGQLRAHALDESPVIENRSKAAPFLEAFESVFVHDDGLPPEFSSKAHTMNDQLAFHPYKICVS